jgi:hypothetical protein
MHAEESSSLQAIGFAATTKIKVDRPECDCATDSRQIADSVWSLGVRDTEEFAIYKFNVAADGVHGALCELHEAAGFEANY